MLAAPLIPYPFNSYLAAAVNVYVLLVFVWAIFSWFDHSKGILADIYSFLDKIVSPYVNIFKRFIPPTGGIDFSPLVAIVLLQVVVRFIV